MHKVHICAKTLRVLKYLFTTMTNKWRVVVFFIVLGACLVTFCDFKAVGSWYSGMHEPLKNSFDLHVNTNDIAHGLNVGQSPVYRIPINNQYDRSVGANVLYGKDIFEVRDSYLKQAFAVQIDDAILRMIEEIEWSDRGPNPIRSVKNITDFSCPDTPRLINGVEDLLCMVSDISVLETSFFEDVDGSFYVIPLHGWLGAAAVTNPPMFLDQHKNPCWKDNATGFHCLPYFQLIGMSKCGSTDLFNRINSHPDVVSNLGILGKEVKWWSIKRDGQKVDRPIESFLAYQQYFMPLANRIYNQSTSSLVTGDGTPRDMWDMSGWTSLPQNEGLTEPKYITPHLIKHINPAVKLLVILRDPTERLLSDFFRKRIGNITTFHDEVVKAIKLLHKCTRSGSLRKCLYDRTFFDFKVRINVGFYSVFLRDWLRVFPRNQFHIIRNEDYASDINHHLAEVYKFLNLRPLGQEQMSKISSDSRQNVNNKKPKDMLGKTRTIVDRLYKSFNIKLAKIMGNKKFLWKTII